MAKFSREKAREIVDLMRGGASQGRAAELAGVSSEAIRQWRRRGEREEGTDHAWFSSQLERVESGLLARCERTVFHSATVLRRTADAKWLLTRLAPEYRPSEKFDWEVRRAVENLLDAIEPHLKYEASFEDLLQAIATVYELEESSVH